MIRFIAGVVVGCTGAWLAMCWIALHAGGTVPPLPGASAMGRPVTDGCGVPGECGRPIGHRGHHGGWRAQLPPSVDLGLADTQTRHLVESLRRRGWTVEPPRAKPANAIAGESGPHRDVLEPRRGVS